MALDDDARHPRACRALLRFAIGDPLWLTVAINVVHGMCYAFFFAAVYIYVDERCPRDARASAQGLFNLVILGIGPFAGSLLWGWLGDIFRNADGSVDFSRLFLAPAALALAAAILMAVAFHPGLQKARALRSLFLLLDLGDEGARFLDHVLGDAHVPLVRVVHVAGVHAARFEFGCHVVGLLDRHRLVVI